MVEFLDLVIRLKDIWKLGRPKMKNMALLIKVNFVRKFYQVARIAKNVQFNMDTVKFQGDITIY